MRKLITIILMLFSTVLFAQEQLDMPGDNLNLYGVLNLFQKSQTLEDFERSLNVEDSRINNLDLNGDGRTDYIQVVDHVSGSAHAIVLRVAVSEFEKQDVAVIEVEKEGGQIHVQVVGDVALYGENYIIEPPTNTPNPSMGDALTTNTVTYVPVYNWAIMSYMYNPYYNVYVSPYRWGYYPGYWNPWTPYYYNVYHGYHTPYYNYYRRGTYYRAPNAHRYYAPYRNQSLQMRQHYNNTYSPGRNRNNNIYKPGNRQPVPSRNYNQPNRQHNNFNQPRQQPQHNNYNQPRPNNNNMQRNQPTRQPSNQSRPSSKPPSGGSKKSGGMR